MRRTPIWTVTETASHVNSLGSFTARPGKSLPGISVGAVMCFIDAQLPMFNDLDIGGIPIRGRKGSAKLLNQPGPLDNHLRTQVWKALDQLLPAAR